MFQCETFFCYWICSEVRRLVSHKMRKVLWLGLFLTGIEQSKLSTNNLPAPPANVFLRRHPKFHRSKVSFLNLAMYWALQIKQCLWWKFRSWSTIFLRSIKRKYLKRGVRHQGLILSLGPLKILWSRPNSNTCKLLTRFCELFDESTEENKLIYMELFQEYNQSIEKFLIQELSKQVEDFSFKSFCDELKCHTNTLSEDILEMVCSITDFSAFKEMVLEHKKSFLVVDPLNSGLVIKKLNFNNN